MSSKANPFREPTWNLKRKLDELLQDSEQSLEWIKDAFSDYLILPSIQSDASDMILLFNKEDLSESPNHQLIYGALKFLTFVDLQMKQSDPGLFVDIFDDPNVLQFVQNFYEISDEIQIRTIKFHRSGTTSYIFECHAKGYGKCALKLIQPFYMNNIAVRKSTHEYKNIYGSRTEYAPEIWFTDETWMIMQFVEGITLDEYINRYSKHEDNLQEEYVHNISSVFEMLIGGLQYYASQSPPIHHGDLNPLNVIVTIREMVGLIRLRS